MFVRISEVDAKGRSHNVSDGYRRYASDSASEQVSIETDAVAHRFAAGSRIRLLVAGGSHPRYARNLGTGDPAVSGTAMRAATHTVAFGEQTRVILPTGRPPSAD